MPTFALSKYVIYSNDGDFLLLKLAISLIVDKWIIC